MAIKIISTNKMMYTVVTIFAPRVRLLPFASRLSSLALPKRAYRVPYCSGFCATATRNHARAAVRCGIAWARAVGPTLDRSDDHERPDPRARRAVSPRLPTGQGDGVDPRRDLC